MKAHGAHMFACARGIPLVLLFASSLAAAAQQPINISAAPINGRAQPTLLSEYTRTIHTLETGLRQNWPQERYLVAFGSLTQFGIPSEHLTTCKGLLTSALLPRTVWDERLPFRVEAEKALQQCRNQRDLLLTAELSSSTPKK